jgi:signal transduction histidine kinase
MIVAWLIGGDSRLVQGLRDAAGGRAMLLHFATLEEAAARSRAIAPDVVAHYAAAKQAPIEELRAMAPGRPIAVITLSRDPLAEAAWLRSGVNAVLDASAIAASADQLFSLGEHAVAIRRETNPIELHLPQAPPDARPSWEAAVRCLARGWNPHAGACSLAQLGVDLCLEALQASRASVLLPSESGGLHVASSANLPEELRHAYQPAHGAALAAHLAVEPRLLRATANSDALRPRLLELFGAQLGAPLWSDAGFEGVILVGPPVNGGVFSPSHEELLLHVSRLLGRALHSARTISRDQEVQTLADWSLVEAPVGLVCLDADHRIEAVNHEAEQLFGVQRTDIAGRHVQALHSGLCDLALRSAAGETWDEPITINRPGGGTIEVRLRRGQDERLLFAMSPTPEPRLHKEQAADAALWESLATRMAQEIKNPLVAINTFAQLLPRKYDSADFRAAFSRVVQEEVDRINKVVDTLYQFAREPQVRLQRLDLKTTVREVTTEFAKAVAERGIEIEHRLSESPLSAVLKALIQNAADAMPEGGRVSVSAEASNRGVEIRVEDTGAGITGDTGRVFDPFFSSKERGTGLGLAVARKLTEAQEGTLELEESAHTGARFLIRFPALTPAHAKSHAEDE